MWFNLLKENTIRIIYSALLVLGGILIAWSIFLIRYTKPETPFYHTATAIVRRSEQIAPQSYRVRVDFTLPNGASISGEGVYNSTSPPLMGTEVLVHYNPYTPTELTVKKLPPVQYQIVIFFGIMIGGLGFRFFIKTIFRNAKIDFIRENGKKVTPSEVQLEEHQVKMAWLLRIPFLIVHCTWKKPGDQDQLEFFSEPFPMKMHDRINLHSVRVFFIPQDPRRYYVHVESGFDSNT